jgi:hypothetical protein
VKLTGSSVGVTPTTNLVYWGSTHIIESKSKHAHMHTIVLAFMVLRRIMDFPIHVMGVPRTCLIPCGVPMAFSLSLFLSCKSWRKTLMK